MSDIRGKKGFETPSHEDLDEYLAQSRRSLSQMKDGKPPLIFKPKRSLSFRVIAIIIILVISTSLMLGGSIINFNPSSKNNNDETITTTPMASTTTEISTTTQMVTTQPLDTETYLTNSIPAVESLINTLIAPNHSVINPVIVNGTINKSQTITNLELFELVWILSQFEENSAWWDLGRDIVFNTYKLWNQSSFLSEDLFFQLLALRSIIAYPSSTIPLEGSSMQVFQNFSKDLWENVSSAYNNETGTFNPFNDSQLLIDHQIKFCQVLAQTIDHPLLFMTNSTSEKATLLLETLKIVTDSTTGLPHRFNANGSSTSDLFYSQHQSNMILSISNLEFLLGSVQIISTLINRFYNYITDIFLQEDWSVAFSYNVTASDLSSIIFLDDQLLYIRANIFKQKRNFADYSLGMVRSNFETMNSTYYTSSEDYNNQFLIDHIHLLLSFEEFLKLEKTDTTSEGPETTSHEPTGAASYGGEFISILFFSIYIIYRRRKMK
jgi:hypothetical protein